MCSSDVVFVMKDQPEGGKFVFFVLFNLVFSIILQMTIFVLMYRVNKYNSKPQGYYIDPQGLGGSRHEFTNNNFAFH